MFRTSLVRRGCEDPGMPISHRTIAILSAPFEGGDGPSHSSIELIWSGAGVGGLLPSRDHNKLDRVLGGLQALQDPLVPEEQNQRVVADLATRLIVKGEIDVDAFEEALSRDGFSLDGGRLVEDVPRAGPSDRLSDYLGGLLGDDQRFGVARKHFEQANRAFDCGDWEAANAQYRSASDAVFDSLAHGLGCPEDKTGGQARKWLVAEGHLEGDEGDLTKAFMSFAGKNGSHAGLSGAAECQLRRHFSTALITYAITKLG